MPDPYAPDWRPEYTGDDRLGDVGTGADGFGAALYDLYRAGRLLYPEAATFYSGATSQIHGLREAIDSALDQTQGIYRRSHWILRRLRDTLHEVLRLSSIHLDETGRALVEVAAAYAATDEAAAGKFRELMDRNDDDYHEPPVVNPEPPRVYAPPPPDEHDYWPAREYP